MPPDTSLHASQPTPLAASAALALGGGNAVGVGAVWSGPVVSTGPEPMYDPDGDNAMPTQAATGPNRRCLSSGEVRPKAQLLRYVIAPDGQVIFDVAERLPARGYWLTPRVDAFEPGRTRAGFRRAARMQIQVPDRLLWQTARSLHAHALSRLGLARRGGAVVLGQAKVEAAVASGEVCALWLASDTSAETARGWTAIARRQGIALIQPASFDQRTLATTLGRANVAIMGLKPMAAQTPAKTAKRTTGKAKPARHKAVHPDTAPPYVAGPNAAIPALGRGWARLHRLVQHLNNLVADPAAGWLADELSALAQCAREKPS